MRGAFLLLFLISSALAAGILPQPGAATANQLTNVVPVAAGPNYPNLYGGLAPGATSDRAASVDVYARGDVNGNGTINSIDALFTLQLSAGLIPPWGLCCPDTAPQTFKAAEVNDDGQVNSIDAVLILQFSAGLVPSLPV